MKILRIYAPGILLATSTFPFLPALAFAGTTAEGVERRTEKIKFAVEGHSPLTAELRVPTGPGPHPLLLLFGGFQNAAKVLDLVNPAEPIALASFDYPFAPPRKFVFPEGLNLLPEARRTIHHMNAAVPALVRHLASRPDIDPRRITVVGASLGAPFALHAASAEPLIRGLALIHGFGDVPATLAWQFRRKWEPKMGFWSRPASWLLGWIGWTFAGVESPEHDAGRLRADQRVLLIES